MKTLKKTLALLAALAMTATAVYGCGDKTEDNSKPAADNNNNNTSDADKPADDTTKEDETPADGDDEAPTGDVLTILCWNANDSEPMVKLFCEKTGVSRDQIYIKNFNCAGGEASEKYDAYLSKADNDADIMFLEADWCLKYINDDNATAPLTSLGFQDSDFADIYPYVVEIGKSTTTGVQKGISWQAAAGGYCYRTDLAEKYLGVTSEADMQEKVKDWDGFKATAKELSEATGGKTAITATLGGLWQVYAGSRDTGWVSADNKLNVDDFCKNYAEYAKEFWDNGYVTKVGQWSDAWKPLGQTEDTLGYFVSTWGFGNTILTEAAGGEGKGSYGNWKCILGPKEFYWGGTWLAPTARCNNQDLAKQFIEFFTTDTEGAEAYALAQGEYMSNQKVMEAIIDGKKYAGAGVLGGQNQFEVLNKVAQGIDMAGKISPYDATIKDAFSKAVEQFCNGDLADSDACLKKFATDVAAAIPSLNWN